MFISYFFYFQLKRWKPIRGQTVRIGTCSLMGLRFFREFSHTVKRQALESVYIKHLQKRMNQLTYFKKKSYIVGLGELLGSANPLCWLKILTSGKNCAWYFVINSHTSRLILFLHVLEGFNFSCGVAEQLNNLLPNFFKLHHLVFVVLMLNEAAILLDK